MACPFDNRIKKKTKRIELKYELLSGKESCTCSYSYRSSPMCGRQTGKELEDDWSWALSRTSAKSMSSWLCKNLSKCPRYQLGNLGVLLLC